MVYNRNCLDVQLTGRSCFGAAKITNRIFVGQSALHKRTRVRAVRLGNGGNL